MDERHDLLGLDKCPYFYTCFNCQQSMYDNKDKGNRNICKSCYESLNKRICTSCKETYYLNKYKPTTRLIGSKYKMIPYTIRERKCGNCASQE